MKDGYNSASRYYLNQFKDAYRQLALDILSGQPISDDLNALTAMISGNAKDEVDKIDFHKSIHQLDYFSL